MDSKDCVIKEAKAFLPFLNEEFLVSISNKGIYKRSLKDLEKLEASILTTVKEPGKIELVIEENTVILYPVIQNSTCSCPSPTLCKHIVMALLHLKQYCQVDEEQKADVDVSIDAVNEELNVKNCFSEFENLTSQKVLSLIGSKEFRILTDSISVKNEAEFDFGELLTVTINSQNVKIYFPAQNSIESAVCSCKEKGICRHKAYAMCAFLYKENRITEELLIEDNLAIEEDAKEFLAQIRAYIGGLLDRGLSGFMEDEISRIEKFYIQAYGMGFFSMADELKSLSSEIGFYFSKNVSFSSKRLLHLLCIIFNRAQGLSSSEIQRNKKLTLAGKKKENVLQLDNITVTGMGSVCRLTKRNDLLISAYFYCSQTKSILAMSTLRPFANSNVTPDFLYKTGIVWSDEISFMIASNSNVALKNARITAGKLSGTKETICQVKGSVSLEDLRALTIADYGELKKNLQNKAFRYFEPYNETDTVFLIQVNEMKDVIYNELEQRLEFCCNDSLGNSVTVQLKFSAVTERAIQYLEARKNQKVFDYLLGSFFEKKGILTATFLGGISEGKIKNIFFKE